MSGPFPIAAPLTPAPCITLIGMAGAGKSTVGMALARELDWAFLDSDHLIEAIYGTRLQAVTDALSKEAFLDVECTVVSSIKACRAVIATGGSVIYREAAMRHLNALGPVVHLDVPFAVIAERVARNPQRGLAIGPGQSLEDLFNERAQLYRKYARMRCDAGNRNPAQCAHWIIRHLPPEILARDA